MMKKMKKAVVLCLLFVMSVSLCGCAKKLGSMVGESIASNSSNEQDENGKSTTTLTVLGSGSGNASYDEENPRPEGGEIADENIGSGNPITIGDGSSASVVNGWDGTWVGGDVKIKIEGVDEEWNLPDIYINDKELHNVTFDEYEKNGDVITGTYHITLDMAEGLDQEQTWSFLLVKNGGSISYYRTNEIIFFYTDVNEDGLLNGEMTLTNQATLSKLVVENE